MDHFEPLAQLTSQVLSGNGLLFPVPPVHHEVLYQGQFWFGHGEFFAPNPPAGAVLTYYLPKAVPNGIQISISDAAGKAIRTLRGPAQAGLNRTCWDLHRGSAESSERSASDGERVLRPATVAAMPWVRHRRKRLP